MKKGFTLIELLVVVLIIGILAAVALPQYHKAVSKSRATQAVLRIRVFTQAVDHLILENGDAVFSDSDYSWNLAEKLDVELPSYEADSSIECGTGKCQIYCDSPDKEDHYHNWSLQATLYPTGDRTWVKKCRYGTSIGKAVCDSLISAGYEPSTGSSGS